MTTINTPDYAKMSPEEKKEADRKAEQEKQGAKGQSPEKKVDRR